MKFTGKIEQEILRIYPERGQTVFELIWHVGIREADAQNSASLVWLGGTESVRRKIPSDSMLNFKYQPEKLSAFLTTMRTALRRLSAE